MQKNRRKKTTQHTATVSSTITCAPRRIQSRTGWVMVAATMLVESDKRSQYPIQMIGFDLQALELMIHPWGERLTVTGAAGYHNGYQITAREMVSEFDGLHLQNG